MCFDARFVGGLSVFHFYLMATNQTTYENFRHKDKEGFQFDEGICNNFYQVLCTKTPKRCASAIQ